MRRSTLGPATARIRRGPIGVIDACGYCLRYSRAVASVSASGDDAAPTGCADAPPLVRSKSRPAAERRRMGIEAREGRFVSRRLRVSRRRGAVRARGLATEPRKAACAPPRRHAPQPPGRAERSTPVLGSWLSDVNRPGRARRRRRPRCCERTHSSLAPGRTLLGYAARARNGASLTCVRATTSRSEPPPRRTRAHSHTVRIATSSAPATSVARCVPA
jgi:hypothetical protein